MQHAQPIPAAEAEAPFSVYVEAAHDQIARTRADGFLNGTRARDGDLARALAILNRDSDRADRSRNAAACVAADHSLGRAA